MKTPSGSTFTQNDGDTDIGRSANLTMGRGDEIGIFKQTDGSFKIDMQPVHIHDFLLLFLIRGLVRSACIFFIDSGNFRR